MFRTQSDFNAFAQRTLDANNAEVRRRELQRKELSMVNALAAGIRGARAQVPEAFSAYDFDDLEAAQYLSEWIAAHPR